MANEAKKQQYLQQVQVLMTQLGQLADQARTLAEVHVDRAYDSAAADAVTDEQLSAFGVAQYDLGVAHGVMKDLAKLAKGVAVDANPATRAVINKWRSV